MIYNSEVYIEFILYPPGYGPTSNPPPGYISYIQKAPGSSQTNLNQLDYVEYFTPKPGSVPSRNSISRFYMPESFFPPCSSPPPYFQKSTGQPGRTTLFVNWPGAFFCVISYDSEGFLQYISYPPDYEPTSNPPHGYISSIEKRSFSDGSSSNLNQNI
jgi:hypothetical protein